VHIRYSPYIPKVIRSGVVVLFLLASYRVQPHTLTHQRVNIYRLSISYNGWQKFNPLPAKEIAVQSNDASDAKSSLRTQPRLAALYEKLQK
jgi:hypothetical protein